MNTPTATLTAATAVSCVADAIDTVAKVDAAMVDTLGGDDLLSFTATLESLGRRVDALRVASPTTVQRRSDRVYGAAGLAQSFGFRTGTDLLEAVTGASAVTVRRRIRVGAAAGPRTTDTGLPLPALFPTVGAALAAGELGIDAAEVIGRELATATPRADVEMLVAAEQALVGQATGHGDDAGGADSNNDDDPQPRVQKPADLLRGPARAWRDALDPDGIEPRAEQARQNRHFWISHTPRGGLHPVGGGVTPDVAATFFAIMHTVSSPHTKPMFLPNNNNADADAGAGAEGGAVGADADATGADDTDTAVPPPVMITLNGDTYLTGAGTGTMSGITEPVAASDIRAATCDGGTQPIWFTPDGTIQALGTPGRFFTPTQRRAIAARDGNTCLDENCDIPATATEAHHVIPDRDGGPTHINNGVLLCWYHHKLIDTGILQIIMINGKPKIITPRWHPRT
jgi:hypothetical protein